MFHGIWPEMLTDVWDSTGNMHHGTRMENCRYANVLNQEQPDQERSYCERYDCVLKNQCPSYQSLYVPTETIEADIEADEAAMVSNDATLTEAELLRMYEGVNTIDVRR